MFARDARVARIVEILDKARADVIALQEVMLAEYNVIKARYGARYHVCRGRAIVWQRTPSKSFNVIVLRRDMFDTPRLKNYEFGLFVHACSRSREFAIFNIHLDDVSSTKRADQMKTILEQCAREPNVILCGDFNANYTPASKLYKSAEIAGFQITNKAPTYFIGRPICIDNIMVKGTLRPAAHVPAIVGDAAAVFARYGSDHLPVISGRAPN